MKYPADIDDLEAFINGLKVSLDSLKSTEIVDSQGFQARFAKAISLLRMKKNAILELQPKFLGINTKEDLKILLYDKLEWLINKLDSRDYQGVGKFKLVMKITNLRARINEL